MSSLRIAALRNAAQSIASAERHFAEYAAKSPPWPYSALRSSGLYHSGICQSVTVSKFVIGTVGFSFV